jgi:hypothetical protein
MAVAGMRTLGGRARLHRPASQGQLLHTQIANSTRNANVTRRVRVWAAQVTEKDKAAEQAEQQKVRYA